MNNNGILMMSFDTFVPTVGQTQEGNSLRVFSAILRLLKS